MSIQLKARDSFYADDVKQVRDGSTFEVETEERAKQLVDRGLAEHVAVKAEEHAPAAEPEAAPKRGRKARK